MSLYQPPEPSRLMEGVIIDVREPNSGNPRYTVDLEQTDQPYPVRVYAWAAPQSYHQAAAGQYPRRAARADSKHQRHHVRSRHRYRSQGPERAGERIRSARGSRHRHHPGL